MLVYKVLSRFVDYEGKEHRLGTYALLDPDKVKQRYRRGCLLLARDQVGARKLVGHPDPRKFHEQQKAGMEPPKSEAKSLKPKTKKGKKDVKKVFLQ